jgi:hypothetical protein
MYIHWGWPPLVAQMSTACFDKGARGLGWRHAVPTLSWQLVACCLCVRWLGLLFFYNHSDTHWHCEVGNDSCRSIGLPKTVQQVAVCRCNIHHLFEYLCCLPVASQAASSACLPVSTTALVIASFTTSAGEPRAQQLEVALPLCLFAGVVPPVKNAGG